MPIARETLNLKRPEGFLKRRGRTRTTVRHQLDRSASGSFSVCAALRWEATALSHSLPASLLIVASTISPMKTTIPSHSVRPPSPAAEALALGRGAPAAKLVLPAPVVK